MERHEVENNPQLKKLVQGEIDRQLAAAIQQGSLQSKNWDEVPLIDLEIHVTTTADNDNDSDSDEDSD